MGNGIGLDVSRFKQRLASTFRAFEGDIVSENVTPESIADQKKKMADAGAPLAQAVAQFRSLHQQAQATATLPLTQEQQPLAQSALSAAASLVDSAKPAAMISEKYASAARLCTSFLTMASHLDQASSEQYLYASRWTTPGMYTVTNWSHETIVQEASAILERLGDAHDIGLKAMLARHRPAIEELRSLAATHATMQGLNRLLMVLVVDDDGHRRHSNDQPFDAVFKQLGQMTSLEPFMSVEDVNTAVRRLVAITALLSNREQDAVRGAFSPDRVWATGTRVIEALRQVAAHPELAGDPADLSVSEEELMEAANLEGGMQSSERPPRPSLTSAEVKAAAENLLTVIRTAPATTLRQ
jgi:hypothetical protein